jgi:hypothetical protein
MTPLGPPTALREVAHPVARRDGEACVWPPPSRGVNFLPSGHRPDHRVVERCQACRQHLDEGRLPQVVLVEERDVRPPRLGQAAIARRGQAAIRLANNGDAAGETLQHRAGAVGAAVVDHDHLEVPVRLAQDTFQRLAKKRLAVVRGDDHGDQGHADALRPYTAGAEQIARICRGFARKYDPTRSLPGGCRGNIIGEKGASNCKTR